MLAPSSSAASVPSPAHRSPRRRALALAALAAALTGCGTDELLEGDFIDPTEIAVDPSDFLGSVPCSPNPGSARAYVMTLVAWDDAVDTTPFVVGSSRPSSCAFVTGFRNVFEGFRYTALVDVYDVPPDSLVPFGGSSSGAREMRDGSGAVVEPRWQTQCGGSASTAAIAVQNRKVFARPCDLLAVDADAPAQLAFSPTLVLGSEAPCDVAPSVDLSFDGDVVAPTSLACDADAELFDVSPGTYQLYARVDDGTDVMGTTCLGTVTAGSTATPTCGTLTTLGNARVDLGGVVDASDAPICPTGSKYDVFDGEVVLNPVPIACGSTAQLGPFDAGAKTLEVTVYDAMGTLQGPGATCTADIEPGRTVDAVCAP